MIIWLLSCHIFMWRIQLTDTLVCWTILYLWDETSLIMVDSILDVFFNLVCWYFIENFCGLVNQRYWHIIFFLMGFCIVLLSGWSQLSEKYLEMFLHFFVWNNLKHIGVLLWRCNRILCWIHLSLGLFLVGRFLTTTFISIIFHRSI